MSSEHTLRVLYLEPYHGGSHAAFTRVLTSGIDVQWTCLTLPGRHWKWRMHGASVLFAQDPRLQSPGHFDVVFASSFTDLAGLVALAPGLRDLPILLYFHENQFAYPVREEVQSPRDNHFGMIQLTSSLVATRCVFTTPSLAAQGGASLLRHYECAEDFPVIARRLFRYQNLK